MEFFEIIKPNTNINFVKWMKLAISASIAIILVGIISVIWHGGVSLGIDFSGGTLIQIKFKQEPSIDKLRESLKAVTVESNIIQKFGDREVVIRTVEEKNDIKDLSHRIEAAMNATYGQGNFEIRRVEVVGPKVGKDLTHKAILAIVFSWVGILLYVGFRFEFRYALGGIISLIHDVLVTIAFFSLLDKEFDLNIVAALLTIVGYSINDTIVIFDRIRENVRKNIRMPLADVINLSVNQTLSRTIITTLTVILVLLILFFFGGSVLHNFAFAMLVGTFAGIYSTIFWASPIILVFEKIKPTAITRKK